MGIGERSERAAEKASRVKASGPAMGNCKIFFGDNTCLAINRRNGRRPHERRRRLFNRGSARV